MDYSALTMPSWRKTKNYILTSLNIISKRQRKSSVPMLTPPLRNAKKDRQQRNRNAIGKYPTKEQHPILLRKETE
jgi:hypothetical protein